MDTRLPGKGNSNTHGASNGEMLIWSQVGRSTIKNSLSGRVCGQRDESEVVKRLTAKGTSVDLRSNGGFWKGRGQRRGL